MSSAPDSSSLSTSTLSTRSLSTSLKRQNKPLIEKRRRARINDCLLQLKKLIAKDGKESCRAGSKLEKADILEMTVDFVRNMAGKQPRADGISASLTCTDNMAASFWDGFSRCIDEVDSFLHSQSVMEPGVHHKLLSHCRQRLGTSHRSLGQSPSHPTLQEHMQTEGLNPLQCHGTSQKSPEDSKVLGESCPTDTNRNEAASSDLQVRNTPISEAQCQNSSEVSSRAPQESGSHVPLSNNGTSFVAPLKLICGGNVFILIDHPDDDQNRIQDLPFPVFTTRQQLRTPVLHSSNTFAACPVRILSQANFNGTATAPGLVIPGVTSETECLTPQDDKVISDPQTCTWQNYKVEKVAQPNGLLSASQHPDVQRHTGQGDQLSNPLCSQSVQDNKWDWNTQQNSCKVQNAINPHPPVSQMQDKGEQPYSQYPEKVCTGLQHRDLSLGDEQCLNILHHQTLLCDKQDTDIQFCNNEQKEKVTSNSPLRWLAGDNMEIQLNRSQVGKAQSALHPHGLQGDTHSQEARNDSRQAERWQSVWHAQSSVNKPAQCTTSAPEYPQSPPVSQHLNSDINNNEVGLPQQASLMWRPW